MQLEPNIFLRISSPKLQFPGAFEKDKKKKNEKDTSRLSTGK